MDNSFTIDADQAVAIKWLITGAEKQGPGSLILVQVDESGNVQLRTNTTPKSQLVEFGPADEEVPVSAAIPQAALKNIINTIDDGDLLTVGIDDEKISLVSAATTLKLKNLDSYVFPVYPTVHGSRIVSGDAETLADTFDHISKSLPSSGGVSLTNDEGQLSLISGGGNLVAAELVPVTVSEDIDTTIPAQGVKMVAGVKKLPTLGTFTIKQTPGLVKFVFNFSDGDPIKRVEATTPEEMSPVTPDNPYHDNVTKIASLAKPELKQALNTLGAAGGGNTLITITTEDGGGDATLTVEGDLGEAKSIIVSDGAHSAGVVKAHVSALTSAIKSLKSPVVDIFASDNGNFTGWALLANPADEEAEDPGYGDILVAAGEG